MLILLIDVEVGKFIFSPLANQEEGLILKIRTDYELVLLTTL